MDLLSIWDSLVVAALATTLFMSRVWPSYRAWKENRCTNHLQKKSS